MSFSNDWSISLDPFGLTALMMHSLQRNYFRRPSRKKLQSLSVICLFVICLVIICLLVCYVRMTIWCKLGALFVNFLWPVEPENWDVQRSRSGPLMSALGQKRTSRPVEGMSALGQKQTSAHVRVMSALPPKADIGGPLSHGRVTCPQPPSRVCATRLR